MAARTLGIAEELGLRAVAFEDGFPYLFAFKKTLLLSRDWERVILQLPPGPALAGLLIAKKYVGNFKLICDVHTGMIVFRDLKQALLNSPFVRKLTECDHVLAHNMDNAHVLSQLGVKNVAVVYDPMPKPIEGRKPRVGVEEGKYIIIPAGWDPDEPFDYLLRELGGDAQRSMGYEVVLTGDFLRTRYGLRYSRLLSRVKGVILTGYIPYEEYAWLVKNSAAVLGITKSEHIMLRAFWEAAAYSRPVIAPRTGVMMEVMGKYPYYYSVYAEGSLRQAVSKLKSDTEESSRRATQLASRLRSLSRRSMARLREIMGDD